MSTEILFPAKKELIKIYEEEANNFSKYNATYLSYIADDIKRIAPMNKYLSYVNCFNEEPAFLVNCNDTRSLDRRTNKEILVDITALLKEKTDYNITLQNRKQEINLTISWLN